jgi:hypothetical protein
MTTKSTKDPKSSGDYADCIRCHFTKNTNLQSFFRVRAFRRQQTKTAVSIHLLGFTALIFKPIRGFLFPFARAEKVF